MTYYLCMRFINKQKHLKREYIHIYLSHCQMNKRIALFHWTRTRVAHIVQMKQERENWKMMWTLLLFIQYIRIYFFLLKIYCNFPLDPQHQNDVYVFVLSSLRQMNWMKQWACLYCSFFAENSMIFHNLMLAVEYKDWKSQKFRSVRNLWPWTPSASNSIIYIVSTITVSHFW